MSLALLKSEVLSVLADAYDETAWSDATLEEALRQTLLFYHSYAEVREATFTILEDGYEHDLSSLAAHDLLLVGWPWSDDGGYILDHVIRPWRLIDENVIRMDNLSLSAGDLIRVQYRPRHTIEYLDGATATTFWEIERQRFVLAAARFALMSRARYYSHYGTPDQRLVIPFLSAAADGLLSQFLDYQRPQPSSSNFISWGSLGL